MTICLGKRSLFGLMCVSFMNFINLCSSFPFSFDGGLWNLIVSIPDHCLSIYFSCLSDLASSPCTFRVHLASTGFLHTCWGK